MRLIDADTLADELFEKRKNYPQWVAETIGNMPEAIVRCKDCKLKECDGRNGTIVCDITGESHNPDWFCADGERREYIKPVTESATDYDGVECE